MERLTQIGTELHALEQERNRLEVRLLEVKREQKQLKEEAWQLMTGIKIGDDVYYFYGGKSLKGKLVSFEHSGTKMYPMFAPFIKSGKTSSRLQRVWKDSDLTKALES